MAKRKAADAAEMARINAMRPYWLGRVGGYMSESEDGTTTPTVVIEMGELGAESTSAKMVLTLSQTLEMAEWLTFIARELLKGRPAE